ncbi:MAG: N-acetylmuramoyl-L-alanine amidase [Alphaproteobacteria bacterium]
MKRKYLLIVLAAAVVITVAGPKSSGGQGRRPSNGIADTQKEGDGEGDGVTEADQSPAEKTSADGTVGSDKARLSAVRYLSSTNYTRVMMDLSREVRFETHRLKEDAAKGLPPRIYIDIFGAQLAMDSKEPLKVDDGLLRQVRVGQFSQDVVRVVLDMNSLRHHNAFMLPDPYRLVIDIQGQNTSQPAAALTKAKTTVPAAKGTKPPAAGVRKIVLDPGHGGRDPGAIGAGGIAEKDLVLSVARKLARKLRREMGIEVVLTRQDDSFVRLEDRTAIANAENADLFVSLHMNASPSGEARGLETYYLDNTTDEASIRLASRENGTARNKVTDLQFILSDMTQNMKLEDSITLAHRLQGSLVSTMTRKMADVRDLGVKKALFYVLVGARMPSVLVEMFFITNKTEGRAMAQDNYQNAVVDSLYDGIQKYNQTVMAAKTL